MAARDWDAEIDAWTERFRHIPDPPPVFARAIAEGWDPAAWQRVTDELAKAMAWSAPELV